MVSDVASERVTEVLNLYFSTSSSLLHCSILGVDSRQWQHAMQCTKIVSKPTYTSEQPDTRAGHVVKPKTNETKLFKWKITIIFFNAIVAAAALCRVMVLFWKYKQTLRIYTGFRVPFFLLFIVFFFFSFYVLFVDMRARAPKHHSRFLTIGCFVFEWIMCGLRGWQFIHFVCVCCIYHFCIAYNINGRKFK